MLALANIYLHVCTLPNEANELKITIFLSQTLMTTLTIQLVQATQYKNTEPESRNVYVYSRQANLKGSLVLEKKTCKQTKYLPQPKQASLLHMTVYLCTNTIAVMCCAYIQLGEHDIQNVR